MHPIPRNLASTEHEWSDILQPNLHNRPTERNIPSKLTRTRTNTLKILKKNNINENTISTKPFTPHARNSSKGHWNPIDHVVLRHSRHWRTICEPWRHRIRISNRLIQLGPYTLLDGIWLWSLVKVPYVWVNSSYPYDINFTFIRKSYNVTLSRPPNRYPDEKYHL